MLRIIGIISLLLVLFTTCERPLELDLDLDTPQLVIISNFSNLDTFEVVLAKTRSTLSPGEFEYIENGEIQVSEEKNGAIKEELRPTVSNSDDNGAVPIHYRGRFVPEPGITYYIRVEVPGFDVIVADDYMPEQVDFSTSSEIITREISSTRLESSKITYDIPLNIFDQLGDDYYHVNLYQEFQDISINNGDTTFFNKTERVALPFTVADNGTPVVPYIENKGMLLDDQDLSAFTTFNIKSEIEFDADIAYPRRLVVELRNVSESYYKYHTSLTRQFQSKLDPLSDQVVVFDNIDKGFGIFAGFNSNIQFYDF